MKINQSTSTFGVRGEVPPPLNFFRRGNRVHVADHSFGYLNDDVRVEIRKLDGFGYDVEIVRRATGEQLFATTYYCAFAVVRRRCRAQVAAIGIADDERSIRLRTSIAVSKARLGMISVGGES